MEKLVGQIAIITGASSGIGKAIAHELAQKGVHLILAARRIERLEALADTLRALGTTIVPVECDVSSQDQCNKLIKTAYESFDHVDILINCAGRADQGLVSLLEENTIDEMMALNLKGPLYLIQGVLPSMRERNGGHIVNINSHVAFHAFGLTPAYAMAKAALRMLTLNLRYELCDTEIHTTGVYPGLVDTEFGQAMSPKGAGTKDLMAYLRHFRAGQRASTEFKRIEKAQKPQAVAQCVVEALENPGQLDIFPQEVHHDSAHRMLKDPQWWHQESKAFYRAFLVPLREMMIRFSKTSK